MVSCSNRSPAPGQASLRLKQFRVLRKQPVAAEHLPDLGPERWQGVAELVRIGRLTRLFPQAVLFIR